MKTPPVLLVGGVAFAAGLLIALLPAGDAWTDSTFDVRSGSTGDLLLDDDWPIREDPNAKTPLMIAAQEGDTGAVSRMIAAGIDVNVGNANGGTPLMYAALGGDPAVVSLLVRAGARTDPKAKLGWTALSLAAVKGHIEVAQVLLDAGADQRVRDAYGWTPLMRAADRERPNIVRVFLEAPGVDVGARQENGVTALHIAAAIGNAGIVRLLVDHGADPSTEDGNGNTAADVARLAGHPEVAEYLEL